MAKGRKTGGRRRGTPNKLTKSAKEAFGFAFDAIGGTRALADWAKDNATEFYKLYARLIPVDLTAGGQGDAIEVTVKFADGNSR
jgi:hypothetical protein